MRFVTTPAPEGDDVPVVGSFAVAAQLRMTTTDTTARLSVALPKDVKATPATLVSALLSLGQQVMVDYRLTESELPEVDVTAVERVETVPATATATGFTLGVINDLAARRSAIAVDSDLLLGNDDGVLLIAATLFAGAEHLLDARDHPTDPATPLRNRSQRRRNTQRRR
ncbi:hypothetical protein [Kocuria rosea]|uniref:hypothetical protein n=1 Tax=Kocuria rosea TaxID=1275 RepID=UPI00253FB49C|nr:hypothetical protein [Kocuria rosea]WIG19366.1 hypothetical protein QOY29_18190 [Kocuria rosea]